MLVDPGDAEEVVSETFAHLWRTAARFVATTNQSVSACLKEIARSRARGLLLAREWPERPSTPPRQGPLITMIGGCMTSKLLGLAVTLGLPTMLAAQTPQTPNDQAS